MLINDSYARQKKWPVSRLVRVGVLGCMIACTIFLVVSLRSRKVYIPDDGFAAEWSYSLARGLVIHKTSAEMHTLCDTNGWGLIDGNILRFAVVGNPPSVVVEYKPFIQPGTQKADGYPYLYGVIADKAGLNEQWRIDVYESLATLQSALDYAGDINQALKPVAFLER
jgi:hypothetical protein